MDPNTLTDAELVALYEQLKQEVANRKTRHAIAEELTNHVDRIFADAPDALRSEFTVGRVHVGSEAVSVGRPDNPPTLPHEV